MTIHVTASLLEAGRRNDCSGCPVALAMREAGFERPMVFANGAKAYVSGARRYVQFSAFVVERIRLIDGDAAVKPFVFHISPAAWRD